MNGMTEKPRATRRFLHWLEPGVVVLLLLMVGTAAYLELVTSRSAHPDTNWDILDPPPDFDWELLKGTATKLIVGNDPQSSRIDVRLLAWSIDRDQESAVSIKALVWARFSNRVTDDRWALVDLSRSSDPHNDWSVYYVPGQFYGMRFYNRSPTNADIYRFLSQYDGQWEWSSSSERRILSGNVNDRTWMEVVREKPQKHYAVGIEQ